MIILKGDLKDLMVKFDIGRSKKQIESVLDLCQSVVNDKKVH
jgi:hypothetical protein